MNGEIGYSADGRKFLIINRECKRCGITFETIWKKKEYCSRKCYMIGVAERGSEWRKVVGPSVYNKNRLGNQRAWRASAIKKLGEKCNHCGFSDIRALQIDHVNGDGRAERTIRKSLNRKIALGLVDINRYQLLCANCNWIKRIENNEQ